MVKLVIILFIALFSSQALAASAVVAGVVAAITAGVGGATLGAALLVGALAAATSFLMTPKIPIPSMGSSQAELKQTIRSARAPKQVTYGKTYRSGAMIFAEEQTGDSKNDDGTYDEWLYMVLGMCAHPINEVLRVDFNETHIDEFEGHVDIELMNNRTTALPKLLTNAPSWTGDMIGKGTFCLYVAMRYDRNLYANGVPTVRVEFEGKRDIWDMRDDSVGYTDNAALVIADYFITYRGYSRDRIITEGYGSFIDAANLCDEQVQNPDNSFSKRYTINGTFELDEKPSQVLDDLLLACGGQLVRIGNRVGLLPAAYYGVASFTITDSHISDQGDVTIKPEVSYGDSINTVKGTFIDPDQDYSEIEFPPVVDDVALAHDGIELSSDLNLRFVTNPYQAQRLASITMRKQNAGGSITLTTNLMGLYARLGRVVALDIQSLGLSGEYRVVEQSAHLSGGIQLSLAAESIDIYDDAIGEPFAPPPLTNLPLGVIPPTNVTFTPQTIGEVVQGILRWEINDPQSSLTEIRFTNEFGERDFNATTVNDSYRVNGLIAGSYTAEVRTVSPKGATSLWAGAVVVIGTPPKIDRVDVSRSNWSIELIPVFEDGAPSGTVFEFFYLADPQSFISGVPSFDEEHLPLARSIFTGSSLNHTSLLPDRYQHYWIRAVSSYGESEFVYVRTGTTKEASLITSSFERLEAIEIQSQNWSEEHGTGYKLFSNDSDPYEMPDGTILENPDGLFVANNAVIRGNINADQLHFSDTSKEVSELGLVQLSGGGFKANPLQGWGITASGQAVFNDGVTCRGATLIGGTIIGATVVAGEIVFNIDSNTDGIPDDLFYVRYPDLPVTASTSYATSVPVDPVFVGGESGDRWFSQSCFGEFNVLSCTENKGEPTQARFRWGRIREGAMTLSFDGSVLSKRNFYRISIRLGLKGENGVIRAWSEYQVFDSGGGDREFTFAGIDWIMEHDNFHHKGSLSGWTLRNKESEFHGSESINNGRIIFDWFGASTVNESWGSSTSLQWSSAAKLMVNTAVNNDEIPITLPPV